MNLRLFCLWATILGLVAATSPVQSPASRRALLERVEIVMGQFPGHLLAQRCPLDVQIVEETDCGPYTRKFLTYQADLGARVPAYLLIPKKLPATGKPFGILTLHQTHPAGQKVVVGLGQSPDDEYAVELARRGYVCLAPAYPHLANYAPSLTNFQSGSMKAIWDNSRGLDLLAEYAGCDPSRFGAIGHSLGGHNALFTAAFDPRLQVLAVSCSFDSFRDYKDGNIQGWTSPRYMPKLLDYAPDRYPFDFDTILAAIAPRPIYINAPKGDTNFKWPSVDRMIASAAALAKEQGATQNVQVEHPDCAHSFPKPQREAAYRLIESILRH